MAKNLSFRFTASSSTLHTDSTSSSRLDEYPPPPPTSSSSSTTVDDSIVHLVTTFADDDTDNEDHVSSELAYCDSRPLRHNNISINTNESDECDIIGAVDVDDSNMSLLNHTATNSTSVFNFKRKKQSATVTSKLVKQFHESFNSSTSSQSTKSDYSNHKVTKVDSPLELIDDIHELSDVDGVSISLASPEPVTPTPKNTATNWLNEMKFNLGKLRPEKKISDDVRFVSASSSISSSSNSDGVGGGGTKNGTSFSKITNSSTSQTLATSDNCIPVTTTVQWQPFALSSNNLSKGVETNNHFYTGRLSPVLSFTEETTCDDDVESTIDSPLAPLVYINDSKLENVKDLKKSNMFRDKDSKKSKSSLTSKKSKDGEKSGNFMKQIISPRSNSISSSTAPNLSNGTNTLFSLLSTNSSTQNKSCKNVSRSCSSSTENLASTVENFSNQNLIIKSKQLKMTPSKSMISFRKMKNDNDEVTIESEDLSSLLVSTNVTTNPTLRRRVTPERRGSPNGDSTSSHEDGLSTGSSESSVIDEIFMDSLTDLNNHVMNISAQKSWSSIFSWTQSLTGLYFIFCFSVAFITFLFCIISPLPAFLNGFILGFMWTFIIVSSITIYLICNFILTKSSDSNDTNRSPTPDSVSIKRTKMKKSLNGNYAQEIVPYAGWVYEFVGDYEQREKEGFVSRLVYVTLYGTKLFIITPSQEMNEKKVKQLLADSSRSMPSASNQRVLDFNKLKHKRVTLYVTKNVRNVRKYIWSKKYPICLEFNENPDSDSMGYTVLPNNNLQDKSIDDTTLKKLVIFARTCREKEEWFWALKTAIDNSISSSIGKGSNSAKSSVLSLADSPTSSNNDSTRFNLSEANGVDLCFISPADPSLTQQYLHILTSRVNYNTFMRTNVLNAETTGTGGSGGSMLTPLTWFNMLLNRMSFDILNKPNWSAYVAKRLQRKLRKLRLPYFMESLKITEIDIGSTLPKFQPVPSAPIVDDAGLWIDFDVNYSGGFSMTLETRVNLMKFTNESNNDNAKTASNLEANPQPTQLISPNSSPDLSAKLKNTNLNTRPWCGYRYRPSISNNSGLSNDEEMTVESDSDLDSILTSSEDEEPETAPADPDDADTDVKQKKFTRLVDKIASSSYFHKATQLSFVKKALVGVSKISLTVHINSISGTLAINIAEPPTDRLWYGFRNDPVVNLTAKPKLGDHDVNLHYITNFIEKKLKAEFFNYFVIPNMDDFFLPALNTNIENYVSLVP